MRRLIALAVLFSAAVSLAGCGAGGGSSNTGAIGAASRKVGRATITLKWPVRPASRLVPIASNRVVVTMKKNGAVYGSPVIMDRPISGSYITTQTVDNLPTGAYTADAIAYPDANSGSVAQAKVLNQSFTVSDGQTASLNLTMASAVSTITVSGLDDLHSIVPHAVLQLSAAAKDASNNTVLTTSNLVYSSSNPSAATVNPTTGLITTLAAGNATITVMDIESGVQAAYSLVVPAAWPYILYTQDGTDSLFGVDDFNGTNWKDYNAGRSVGAAIADARGIARDKEGRLYLATYTAGTITRINDMSGAGYTTLTIPSGRSFSSPNAVAVDSQDRIYIADAGGKIVRVDNMNGDNWTEYSAPGSGVGRLGIPYSIALDAAGRIYVGDIDNGRLIRFDDMTGAGWIELTTMGGQVLSTPYSIALDSSGGIYVADAGGDRIAYAANMSDTTGLSYGGFGSGVGQFQQPGGVALDDSGKIYIADINNNRLVCIQTMAGVGWHTYGSVGSGAGFTNGPAHILLQ